MNRTSQKQNSEHTHKRRLFVWDGNAGLAESPRADLPSGQKSLGFISLFSGAMGLDLGLKSAGFNCLGCLEVDGRACQTIRRNCPDLPVIEGDIRNWTGPRILKHFNVSQSSVQLISGGPPCPSFSTAGKRKSFEDPRGEVMFDFLRIVEEIRPPFFVLPSFYACDFLIEKGYVCISVSL